MSEKHAKKPALGRGLSALLGNAEETYGTAPAARPIPNAVSTSGAPPAANGLAVRRLGIDQLQPGKYQPRHRFNPEAIAQLADSIRARGVLQPILARPAVGGKFEIIAGERRWRAAQEAQLTEVPVIVQDFGDSEALEIGLIENLQRTDLNALEEAEAYQRLMAEFGHTQAALADTIGKSRSHIANTLRLTGLPEAVKTMVVTERLTAGHARALIGAENAVALAEQVVAKNLSVRETEKLVAAQAKKPGIRVGSGKKAPHSADVQTVINDLSERLGMKVEIDTKGTGGRLSIHFGSLDQFDDLLARLTRSG